jgi:hypothetical protein
MDAKTVALGFIEEGVCANEISRNCISLYPDFLKASFSLSRKDKQKLLILQKESMWQKTWIWFTSVRTKHTTIHSPEKKTGQYICKNKDVCNTSWFRGINGSKRSKHVLMHNLQFFEITWWTWFGDLTE